VVKVQRKVGKRLKGAGFRGISRSVLSFLVFLSGCAPPTLDKLEESSISYAYRAPEPGSMASFELAQKEYLLDEKSLEQEAQVCRQRMFAAQEKFAYRGAPRLEEHREMVLVRGKAEPVLFLEVPQYKGEVSRGIRARRRALLRSNYPRDVMRQTMSKFFEFPKKMRQLILRDGYLYTDDARAARFVSINVKLEKLFREPNLVLLRGSQEFDLKKGKGGLYHFASGETIGERARFLLFDRVWVKGERPGPPVHVDVREISRREGFEGMRVVHLGDEELVMEVRFGSEWVPALLKREGTHLSLDCLAIEPKDAARVGRARDEAYRRSLVLYALRSAIAEQIRLGLPFDEPRTERGQQDGKLRARWERAYYRDKKTYKFNGDKYSVYNEKGAPMTPQVCIDFVTESLERASGMFYSSQGQSPEQVRGALDFDEILQGHRRQELAMRSYARLNPHRLSMIDYKVSEWVHYEKVNKFYAFLRREKDRIRPGDIVIIRGRAAWDRYAELHTHTFFIYESDPITSMPTLIAGNAGKPRISTWDDEMLRAPKRSIRHRIRPNMEWLYDHIVLRTPLRGERWAAPLSVNEN